MSRRPFIDLPSGCETIDFDIDIVPDAFTMCTVPDVTSATQVPMTFHLDIPDLVAPPYCQCFPELDFSRKDFTINLSAHYAGLYFSLAYATENPDCCDPSFTVHFDLDIPCLPFEFGTTGTLRTTNSPVGSLDMHMTRQSETCAFDFSLDINVPCNNFDVNASGAINLLNNQDPPSFAVNITRIPDTCILELDQFNFGFNVDIPCNSFDITTTGTAELIATSSDVHLSMWMSKSPDTCILQVDELKMGFDLQIPCVPFEVNSTGTIQLEVTKLNPYMSMWLSKIPDTCALQLEEFNVGYEINIPYVRNNFTAEGVADVGTPSDDIALSMWFSKSEDTCILQVEDIKLNYDLSIPCTPFAVERDTVFTGTEYNRDNVMMTMYLDGDCILHYDAAVATETTGCSTGVTFANGIRWHDDCLQWRYGIKYYGHGLCYSVYIHTAWSELICATGCTT